MLNISDFQIKEKIIESHLCSIFSSFHKITKDEYIIKTYRVLDPKSKKYTNILNEIVLLSKCNHPNLVTFFGFSQNISIEPALREECLSFYLILEKMNSDLNEKIIEYKQNKKTFDISEILDILNDIVPALAYLEEEKVAHQNLKPSKIFIKNGIYKIGDVVSGKNLFNSSYSCDHNFQWSLSYFSPERIDFFYKKNTKIDYDLILSDVFSLGLILIELCTLESVVGMNNKNTGNDLITKKIKVISMTYNQILVELIENMIDFNPNKRKSFKELLADKKFKTVFNNKRNVGSNTKSLNLNWLVIKDPKKYEKEVEKVENIIRKNSEKFEILKKSTKEEKEIYRNNEKIIEKEISFEKNNEYQKITSNNDSQINEKNKEQIKLISDLKNQTAKENVVKEIKESDKFVGDPQIVEEINIFLLKAETFRKDTKYNEALDYYEKALKLKWEKTPSQNDLQSADILYGLGHVCIELGNYKKGKDLHENALKIRVDILGDVNKITADSYNSLGVAYHGQGQYNLGQAYFEKSLDIYKKIYGEYSKETALGYNNLGGSYSLVGDHQKALEYKEKALEIKKVLYKGNIENEDIAWSYDNIGIEYSELGDTKKALDYKQMALEMRKKVLGENSPQIAISYNNIAVEMGNLGEHKKSLDLHEKALAIRQKTFGELHPETARSYHNIGCCYFGQKSFPKALEFYEKAYNIRKNILGQSHIDTKRSFRDSEDARRQIKK